MKVWDTETGWAREGASDKSGILEADGFKNRGRNFLTAEWRNLAMLNYEVDPSLLTKFVPSDTELDYWNGKTFISLVGFQFLNTRICGISVPFHCNFDEVNLRFYVRRIEADEIRRGVVFVREVVPRWAIAALARTFYNERYVALPMNHKIEAWRKEGFRVDYAWRSHRVWNSLRLRAEGEPTLPAPGSEEQFITEHYWGYAAQRDGSTIEYRVAHAAWEVWSASDANFEGDMSGLYGRELAAIIQEKPSSAFLAKGSAVTVSYGSKI